MNVKLCPHCNSLSLKLDAAFWGDRIYVCNSCGYRSPLVAEITVKNTTELKKLKVKKMRKTGS